MPDGHENTALYDAIATCQGTKADAVGALRIVLSEVVNAPAPLANRWVEEFLKTTSDPLAIAGAAKLVFDVAMHLRHRHDR